METEKQEKIDLKNVRSVFIVVIELCIYNGDGASKKKCWNDVASNTWHWVCGSVQQKAGSPCWLDVICITGESNPPPTPATSDKADNALRR